MKKKLLGVVICMMLITTYLTVAQPAEKKDEPKELTPPQPLTSQIDVPVWEIGDQWTYRIDDITINNSSGSRSFFLNVAVPDLPLTVINTTGEFYTLSFDTTMNGQLNFYSNQGSGPINISITLDSIALSGKVLIEKSTLGIKEVTVSLVKQKFIVDFIQQPYIPLPRFLQRISPKVTMNLTTTCDTPFALLSFPLNTGIMWNLTSTFVTVNGKIQCLWLDILNILNKLGTLINIQILPPEFAALLPIIDVKEALTTFGSGNVFSIPPIEDAFSCLNTESITVPGGTYTAYNITLADGVAHCYYAPSAGNVVKLSGNFQEILPNLKSFHMELVSTNYS